MSEHLPTPPESRSYLLLETLGQLYCLEMSWTRSVVDIGRPTRVPGAPGPLLGVVDIDGRVTAIADLSAALGHGLAPEREHGTAVVVAPPEADGAPLALVADVLGVLEITDQSIEKPPSFGLAARAALVSGVAHLGQERLALVLDPAHLLASFEAGAAS